MKHLIIGFLAVTAFTFGACNSGNPGSEKKDAMASEQMSKVDSGTTASMEKIDAPVIKASFTNVSTEVAAHMKDVTSHYFHIRHALVSNDAAEAKKGATMMLQVISQFDNSLLAADQKTEYAKHISAIKEHADAIVKSADINAERTHFADLSTHTYELIKAFGAGKKIYYDHCPMALDNKGANWLSEVAAIQNPYFKGTEMNACVKIEQVIE